jgi:hypothetical protein
VVSGGAVVTGGSVVSGGVITGNVGVNGTNSGTIVPPGSVVGG